METVLIGVKVPRVLYVAKVPKVRKPPFTT